MILASNMTTGDLTAALVISTGSVHIFGIVLANEAATAADVDITDAASTIIMQITIPADNTVVMNIPFIANNGLRFALEAATTKVTVMHSSTVGSA
jgi:hypothetical protein